MSSDGTSSLAISFAQDTPISDSTATVSRFRAPIEFWDDSEYTVTLVNSFEASEDPEFRDWPINKF